MHDVCDTTPSYQQLLDEATKLLYEGSETPRIDAELLLQHVIEKPLAWLIAYSDTLATADHLKRFNKLVSARQTGQPIAYLTGQRDFWSLTLNVNENVLIPRADTETLVEQALERLPMNRVVNVLELGTGSGAIALSIAKERPEALVLATDFHSAALTVAKSNAERNNIHNISFQLSDWFKEVPDNQKYDLIAANPPYVEAGDPHLQRGDLRFEPSTSLVASGSGLSDLQTIIQTAPTYLSENGWLIVEHGYNQAEQVHALFQANSFSQIELHRDINDLPRCTIGQR